jgi:hypothetical protein
MPTPVAPCPVEQAIQVIGGKWKLLVLRSLLLNEPQRYNELLTTVTAISQKEYSHASQGRNQRESLEAQDAARNVGLDAAR